MYKTSEATSNEPTGYVNTPSHLMDYMYSYIPIVIGDATYRSDL